MAHNIKLDVFEGPIDVLLQLITRRRVDIYEVSLATITEEYLATIAARADLDLETATGFLVVAATLVELKSARLLPERTDDPDRARLLEERDLLLARLVECATYREAGMWLRGRLAQGDLFQPRAVSIEPAFAGLVPDLLARVRLEDLAHAAARAIRSKPRVELDTSHVAPIRASVRDAVAELAELLEERGEQTFASMCTARDRIEVVVRFLALLELFKAGAVELRQPGRWADLVVSWTGAVPVDRAVAGTDEYAAAEEVAK
jgi:segregation and condensation protein A